MRERDLLDAISGDAAAASRVVSEAMRRGQWTLVGEIAAAMTRDETEPAFRLTDLDKLRRGVREFEGDCHLPDGSGVRLPDGLHVRGRLSLVHCTVRMGNGIRVEGSCDMYNGRLSSPGEDFYVGGDLALMSTRDVVFGLRWHVDNVYAEHSRRLRITSTSTIRGDLRASGSEGLRIEAGVSVGGSVDLDMAKAPSLPEGFTVPGDLSLDGACEVVLPRGLVVQGDLRLRVVEDTIAIPEDLRVAGDLYVNRGQTVPDSLRHKVRCL